MTKIDAPELARKIRAGEASAAELEQGMALLKAIEAQEGGEALTADQAELLKAASLIADGDLDIEGEEATVGVADAGADEAEDDAPDASRVAKSLSDGPADLPEVGSLMEEIARAGQEAAQAVNVAPVLQAQVAWGDRMCKALDDLAVAVLAQNELLARNAAENEAIRKSFRSLEGTVGAIQKALSPENPEGAILKALGGGLGQKLDAALGRVSEIEEVLNNRPRSGNPPRGQALAKALREGTIGGDGITFHGAIERIQKSALPDYEKVDALNLLQTQVGNPKGFAEVLGRYDLLAPAN